jgi:hypothetical protein
MLQTSDSSALVYQQAWVGVALVFAYYLLATIAFRWRWRTAVTVTKYEPPQGISPAIAAFLWERGRCERAFAAAFVSAAAKGAVKIQQKEDAFLLYRMREADASLSTDESCILNSIFLGSLDEYSFNAFEYGLLDDAFDEFRKIIKQTVKPALVSAHFVVWLAGVVFSAAILVRAFAALPLQTNGLSLLSIYPLVWIAVGGSCFVAALHAWAATLRRLSSFIPGVKGRRRPLSASDALPVFLSAAALLGFGFLGSFTSPEFASLTAAVLLVCVIFRHALESPTTAGYRVLAELKGFREFLSRAEADQLNRVNRPGTSPEVLTRFTAYGVALDVERGWGEGLAENLLQLLQFDEAYHRYPLPDVHMPAIQAGEEVEHFIQLGLSPKKSSDSDDS